jgi:hypothetical protein
MRISFKASEQFKKRDQTQSSELGKQKPLIEQFTNT